MVKKSTSANGLKRGKTQLAKSCLIGLEIGAKPAMPSRHTLDTRLKTVREKSFLFGLCLCKNNENCMLNLTGCNGNRNVSSSLESHIFGAHSQLIIRDEFLTEKLT